MPRAPFGSTVTVRHCQGASPSFAGKWVATTHGARRPLLALRNDIMWIIGVQERRVRRRFLSTSPTHHPGSLMSQVVDFTHVSTEGLETSPVADALVGLRANEARYFKNKYDHTFAVDDAADVPEVIDRVSRILEDERGIEFAAVALVIVDR